MAQRAAQREPEGFTIYRESGDKFHIDPEMIPEGFSYEWKRHSVLGQEDRRHLVNLGRNKWTPVPADRHPEIGGDPTEDKDGKRHPYSGCIIMDGLILMERPIRITKIVRADDKRQADQQVAHQMGRLSQPPVGTLSDHGQRNVSVKRDRDLSVPEDAE